MGLKQIIKFYLLNSNLHGLHHIGDETKNVLYRLIWLLIIILSTIGMLRIFRGSYESYQKNAISFATETTYLDWNTTFPAISVCEMPNTASFVTADPGNAFSPVQQYLADIIFFTGSCYACNPSCEECYKINVRQMTTRHRKKCNALINKCKWNNQEFKCCDHFLPLNTEYGVCYVINSMHTSYTNDTKPLNMFSNRKTGAGQLVIGTNDDMRLYIHAPEDVPFINSDTELRKEILMGEHAEIDFNVIEIANDETVRNIDVEKRACRYPDETYPELIVHKLYSYSTCVVQCHADAHYRLCNCTHHFMPVLGVKQYCDIRGLLCLTEYFETVNRLHAKGFDKPGLVCECLPSCVEPEYKIVSDARNIRATKGEVTVRMKMLPTLRFKRNVVRTTLDLVVSIGGTAGLFIGASLLSIIETLYLLILRRH